MPGFTPNRIVLISRGRHEEMPADEPVWPGMICQKNADGNIQPRQDWGGSGVLYVAKEDALQGGDITQRLGTHLSTAGAVVIGDVVPVQAAAKGDKLLFLLQKGQNVAQGTKLMSAGDGTLIADPGEYLFVTAANSTVITNTSSETIFSNGQYTAAANLFQIGDVVRMKGTINVLSENASDTVDIKVYGFGLATALLDFTALQLPAGSQLTFALEFRVTGIGAALAGNIVGTGTYTVQNGPPVTLGGSLQNVTETAYTLASTAITTTATTLFKVSATWSAANAADQVQLVQPFQIELARPSGYVDLVEADEAINNSAGVGTSGFNSAAFIRGIVI